MRPGSLWALSAAAAAAAAFLCALREARAARVDPETVWEAWPWAILGGFLGARLYYLAAAGGAAVFAWSSWSGLNLFRGTSIQGGMLGGLLALFLYMRRRRLPVLPLLDAFAPGAALAHAVTRLGCFAAGCCYGRPTSLPWAVVFTHPQTAAPRGVPLHPAQLYEAALDLGLACWLHQRLASGALPAGGAFWRYLGGYSVIRFAVQFLRDDDAGRLLFGLAHSQYLALAMLAAALAMLRRDAAGVSERRARPSSEQGP